MNKSIQLIEDELLTHIKRTQNKPYRIKTDVINLRDKIFKKSGHVAFYPLTKLQIKVSELNLKDKGVIDLQKQEIAESLFI